MIISCFIKMKTYFYILINNYNHSFFSRILAYFITFAEQGGSEKYGTLLKVSAVGQLFGTLQ